MIPGPVTVYEGAANVCFAHGGIVTKQSQRVILDLHKITMVGFMPQKAGFDFRWGFSGYATDKAAKDVAKAGPAEPSDDDTDAKFDALMASKEKSAPKRAEANDETDRKPARPAKASRHARKPRPTES